MTRALRFCLLLALLLVAGRAAAAAGGEALSLFETPRDKARPIIDAIGAARREVDVEVYELTDDGVEGALVAAQARNVTVKVILNDRFPGRNGDFKNGTNDKAAARLKAAGAQVQWSSPAFHFTHEKGIIVDSGGPGQEVLIMTMNLSPGYLGEPDKLGQSLNFGIVDRLPDDVAQVHAMFEDDWERRDYRLPSGSDLVVSPLNSRRALLAQIRNARRSVHFFEQELQDPEMVAALVAACRRGVEVRGLVAPNMHGNRESAAAVNAAGGQVRVLARPYEHAKAIISDAAVVSLGSINGSPNSMDNNRELGIMTWQASIAAQMESAFAEFWALGQAFK